MIAFTEYLKTAVKEEASDLFIVAGSPITIKRDGHLFPLNDQKLLPDSTNAFISEIYRIASRDPEPYLQKGDDDFSFAVPGLARFRVNAYRQRGSMAAVIRIVSFDIPDWQELNIPAAVMELADLTHGMILVAGTAGSGKSTTQACLIDKINRTRDAHVITLEDPIEFLHRNVKSIISQREINIDTQSYHSALRACMRQSPDVIFLGEMRDYATMRTAMTASETGHLLLTTLHTNSAAASIDRIIDEFPPEQQPQIRTQLAPVLQAVISQRLLPGINRERIPAFEIMKTTPAIRSLIRDNKVHQINNVIATGAEDGMISMDQSILNLYRSGKITKKTALDHADNPEQMLRRLQDE